MYSHTIPINIVNNLILTSKVIRGHWRSSRKGTEGQNRSKIDRKYIYTNTIPISIINNLILTSKVIKGH